MIWKKRFAGTDSTFSIAIFALPGGYSLIELLVSIVLSFIVMGAIYSVYRFQTRSLKVQENRMEAQQYVRSVLDLMVREIRNVGYFPDGACTTTPANTNGIIDASAQRFQFVYDANANGLCTDLDENITYGFDTTGCPAGFGNITRNAVAITDCNIPDDPGKFSLAYYPKDCSNNFSTPVGSGTAACPGTTGGDAGTLAAIQRVKITVTGHSKNPDTDFGGQLISTMTSNVDLRNIGLPP